MFPSASAEILGRIHAQLTLWREHGVSGELLTALRGEFRALCDDAEAAEHDDVAIFCARVERILAANLASAESAAAAGDVSLLHFLEEIHDALSADVGCVLVATKAHIKALNGMLESLLPSAAEAADGGAGLAESIAESESASAVESKAASPAAWHGESKPAVVAVSAAKTLPAAHTAVETAVDAACALLVRVGRHRFALPARLVESAVRAYADEIVEFEGRHYFRGAASQVAAEVEAEVEAETEVEAEIRVPVIYLAAEIGETPASPRAPAMPIFPSPQAGRRAPIFPDSLVFPVYPGFPEPADGAVAHVLSLVLMRAAPRLVAVAVDEFLGIFAIVVKPPGAEFAALRGVAAAAVLADASEAAILDPNTFLAALRPHPVAEPAAHPANPPS